MTAITSKNLVPSAYAVTADGRFRSRRGFTLIELLVVIGIIGVLAGIMMLSFGGATESARAAGCLSNMKQLAQAANSKAMETGYYPLAGSLESIDIDEARGTEFYRPLRGWISWLDNKNQYPMDDNGDERSPSHKKIDVCPYYGIESSPEDNEYAITNGTIWVSVGRSRGVYTCPEHVRACDEAKLGRPLWSYVMNAYFKYDYSQGTKAVGARSQVGRRYGTVRRADRTIMFAEISVGDKRPGSTSGNPKDSETDCTLQYKATINGKTYNGSWGGKPESIGFMHKAGKRNCCAHVAFADGHTEKLLYSEGGLKPEDLTALLCEGVDVSFGKNGYQMMREGDESN